jgi:KDO2-lipid IV(A) lauroyltransferase
MSDEESKARRLSPLQLLRYSLESAAFFLFIGFFKLLGLDGASAFGGFIGREVVTRIGMSNRARVNLRAAYPEKSEAEIEAIVREMCESLGRTFGEYAHFDKIRMVGADPRIIVEGAEHPQAAAAQGQGILFVSGHFANWEIMPAVAVDLGLEGGGEVYRPQNNPFVDRWLVKKRMIAGPKDQIAKGARGTRRIFTLLRRGKSICLLVDQKTNEGIPAVYFGREAMTTPAPAALALRLNAALIPAQLQRVKGKNARFRLRFHPPIPYKASADHESDIAEVTQRITTKIEEIVRERPSQWLWIHRRWPTGRAQDRIRRRQGEAEGFGGAGVRVERDGSSLT